MEECLELGGISRLNSLQLRALIGDAAAGVRLVWGTHGGGHAANIPRLYPADT